MMGQRHNCPDDRSRHCVSGRREQAQREAAAERQAAWEAHEKARQEYQPSTLWQYHVESFTMADRLLAKHQAQELLNFRQRLDSLGAKGWEMVGMETIPLYGTMTQKLKGYIQLAYFKRPVNG